MNLELSQKQFRRLLDLVYIGNWILNSTRGDQRFTDYDEVESLLFGKAALEGMPSLAELYQGEIVPSRAFVECGIHEAIMEYENNVFFDILAEDLARRDMDDAPIDESNYEELTSRIQNLATRGIAMEPGQTLADVLAQRAPLYERYADLTVDCLPGQTLAQTTQMVLALLNGRR